MRLRLSLAGAAALLTAAVFTSGCSLGSRQAMADRVIGATRAVEAIGATGTVAASVVVLKTKVPVAPGPPRIINGAAGDLASVFDFSAGRAAVAQPGNDTAD